MVIRKIIKEMNSAPVARISPADAIKRKINTGQRIRVFKPDRRTHNRNRKSNQNSPVWLFFPNGIWFNEGGGVNQLISGEETDIGFGAAFHDNRVEIERVD